MIKKKTKILIAGAVVIVVVIIGGCIGFNEYQKNKSNRVVDKGITYLNDKDYSGALAMFNLALSENNNTKAQELKNDIDSYQDAQKDYQNGDIAKALTTVNGIKDYESYSGFTNDINDLKGKIKDAQKEEENNDKVLTVAENDINAGRLQTAQDELNGLNGKKFLTTKQKDKITQLNTKIKETQDKAASDARAAMDAKIKQDKDKAEKEADASSTGNYTFPLSQDECLQLLKSKLPGGFGYLNRTGAQGTVMYEFTHNVNGVNGPHVLVNTDNGTIYDEEYNVLSGPIK